jgi:hypothetical protein
MARAEQNSSQRIAGCAQAGTDCRSLEKLRPSIR